MCIRRHESERGGGGGDSPSEEEIIFVIGRPNGPFPDNTGSQEAGAARGAVPWGKGELNFIPFQLHLFGLVWFGSPSGHRQSFRIPPISVDESVIRAGWMYVGIICTCSVWVQSPEMCEKVLARGNANVMEGERRLLVVLRTFHYTHSKSRQNPSQGKVRWSA